MLKMEKAKMYFFKKIGLIISPDGFIITETLFSKLMCNLICSFKNKPVVKLGQNLYIINK